MKRKKPHAPPRGLKPRNPVVLALQQGQGARGGVHGKSAAAKRRAAEMALAKENGKDEANEA